MNVLSAATLFTLKWLILCCHCHLKIVKQVEEGILICLLLFCDAPTQNTLKIIVSGFISNTNADLPF